MQTIDLKPRTVTIPLREDPPGTFRVGASRVLLELVLRAFKAGATPEAIVQSYDTLVLADVYAVLSSYLATPAPFEEYLRRCDQAAAATRQEIEEAQGSQEKMLATLLIRAKAKEGNRAPTSQR